MLTIQSWFLELAGELSDGWKLTMGKPIWKLVISIATLIHHRV